MLSDLMTKFQLTSTKHKAAAESAWITDLEHMEYIDALKLTIEKIPAQPVEANKSAQRQADVLIKNLLLIDDSSYERVQAVTADFMRVARDNKVIESRVIDAVYSYQRRLYLSYKGLIDFIIKEKLNITVDQIHSILARTINAAFLMAKWRYFQDQLAPVGTWTQIYEIVKVVEGLSLLHKSILLYETDEKELTIATLLVRGYMLDTLTKGSYTRQQIELTAQVLNKWIINAKIQNQYVKSEHTFLINLDSDKGSDRARGFSVAKNSRFWKTDILVGSIQTYLCDAATNKPLQRFNLNSLATANVLVELFNKLLTEWIAVGYKRQRRHENRASVNKMLNIHRGFEGICKKLTPHSHSTTQIKANKLDATLFELRVAMHAAVTTTTTIYQKNPDAETWLIVDESPKGLGASLGAEVGEWVEPGKLVGFSSQENLQKFVIAEIKSVKKLPNGRYRVGLEVLNTQSKIAQISQLEHDSVKEVADGYFVDFSGMEGNQQAGFSGLYLPSYNQHEQAPMMIIPKSEYKPASQYLLNIGGDEQRVLIERAMSYRDDWVRVKVKLLS